MSTGSPSSSEISSTGDSLERMPTKASPNGVSDGTVIIGQSRDVERAHGLLDAPMQPLWPTDLRAYRTLFGCWLLMFDSWGLVNAFGTFASYYKQHLMPGRDDLFFNLIGAVQCFFVLGLSAIVGRILDAGHSRLLLVTGTVLISIGMFTLSLSNGNGGYDDGDYGLVVFLQGIVTGLGMACFFVSSSQIAITWFPHRRGFCVGIVATGASMAGLVYPVMTKFLITGLGFSNAVQCVAAVVTGTSILASICARPSPAHISRRPQRWLDPKNFWDSSAFSSKAYSLLVLSMCLLLLGFYSIFFSLEEWAAFKGFGYKDETPTAFDVSLPPERLKDAIRTFYLLSIMNASSTIGRLSSACLSDPFGALRVHAIVTFVAAILVLVLWPLASTVSGAIAFVVIFGASSGAVIGLPPAGVSQILGKDQDKLGQRTGMMYTCASPFALVGPIIAGHLVSLDGGYNYLAVQMWSGGCLAMSALCMAMAAMVHGGKSKA